LGKLKLIQKSVLFFFIFYSPKCIFKIFHVANFRSYTFCIESCPPQNIHYSGDDGNLVIKTCMEMQYTTNHEPVISDPVDSKMPDTCENISSMDLTWRLVIITMSQTGILVQHTADVNDLLH